MDVKTFAELCRADERTRRFTSLGFATHAMLTPEDAAEFQQLVIAGAELAAEVPDDTRRSYERIRSFHSYGVLCYDLFTLTDDLAWIVLEQALRERFIAYYDGRIPIVDVSLNLDSFPARDFQSVYDAFRRGGSHNRWRLKLEGTGIPMPLTLAPLLRWARRVRLLDGQRNRRLQLEIYPALRNHFAHGGYRLGMPNESARSIHDLAEIINRLWGAHTPGGRIYPAPLRQGLVVLGWSEGWPAEVGSTFSEFTLEQFQARAYDGWTYLVVQATNGEQRLREFDARYELTDYPSKLRWGPGSRKDAAAWLTQSLPVDDSVQYLDRLFAIRQEGGKTYLPMRPGIVAGLPAEFRPGVWMVVRSDFPLDALAHIRHRGSPCPDQEYGGCPVEELGKGSWPEVVKMLSTLVPTLLPEVYSSAGVPRRSYPDAIGY